MLFFASGFINYCFAMNNDYFFINSSDTSQQLALPDEFLSENYEFRHNVLSDVYEIRELGSEPKPFRPFTREARNSLLRRIKSEGLDIQSPGLNVDEYVYSEETPLYDPASDWLQSLPAWDGRNHVAELFDRIPAVTTEQHHLLAIWLRSTVAHWSGMDMMHGNECVVTQKCRLRYASFVSTTNNPRPLNDPTGSRRYLCIRIPEGELINNETVIDYEQLYAQVA